MNDQPVQPLPSLASNNAELLAAFRKATGWADDRALHLAACDECAEWEDGWQFCDAEPATARERAARAVARVAEDADPSLKTALKRLTH